MKRILIDIRLLSKGGASGIEGYTRDLIDHLLRLDKENTYEFFYNGLRKTALKEFREKNLTVHEWRIPNKIFDSFAKFLNEPKVERFIKADLIFTPHFNILPINDVPRVITFHDLSMVHHPDFYPFRKNMWHWFQDYGEQARRAARVIAVSDFTKDDLVTTLHVSADRIFRIYPGVNPMFREFQPNDERLIHFAEAHNLRKPYILYLGTVEPRKNVPAVIRAFNLLKTVSELKEYELVIAGAFGWLYENVQNEIEKSPYKADIRVLGRVSHEDRPFLYNLASVFVYPSFFEGFGFPPLEAQACGTPVVASNRTSLPEILKNSAILVDPWSVYDLSQAVSKVLLTEEVRSKLRKDGLENSKCYTWEKSAKETLAVFNSIS